MTGKQAPKNARANQVRTLGILKPLPNKFFEYYPEYMEMVTFGKPSAIMAHIANAEIMYIQDYKIGKGMLKYPKYNFDNVKKDEILSVLARIRDVTNN